jgi:hypothetical protein
MKNPRVIGLVFGLLSLAGTVTAAEKFGKALGLSEPWR